MSTLPDTLVSPILTRLHVRVEGFGFSNWQDSIDARMKHELQTEGLCYSKEMLGNPKGRLLYIYISPNTSVTSSKCPRDETTGSLEKDSYYRSYSFTASNLSCSIYIMGYIGVI